jgi:hypothetical protein
MTDYNFTYEWKVTSMRVRDEGANKNAVVQTFWELKGTNADGHSAVFSGATPFTSVNVPEGDFIALEALTQEHVISWIRNYVDNHPNYWEHINEQLAKNIQDTHAPITEASVSWLPANTVANTGS